MGSPHSGRVHCNTQYPTGSFQQLVLGSRDSRSGCVSTRLEKSQQLRKSTLLSDSTYSPIDRKTGSGSDNHSSLVACTTVVSKVMQNDDFQSLPSAKQPKNVHEDELKTRTLEELGVAGVCLENLWEEKLRKQGWSDKSKCRFIAIWAPSTLSTYNRVLSKFEQFCDQHGMKFPNVKENELVDYLCYLAANSDRPKSTLNTTAAITCFCEATGMPNLISQDLSKLIVGLIKSSTSQPMRRSKVMPLNKFTELFLSWPGNYLLTLEKLRMKCIVLLAISAMLRPSDAAPLSKVFNEGAQKFKPVVLSTKNLKFHDDGSLTIIFHGIKNDYDRDGFEVNLPRASTARVDPSKALQCYISRTKYIRSGDCPLFLSLKKPFNGISATSVARVLDKAIELVSLKSEGFSAKHFRPSAATSAIQQGIHPDMVMRVGRWKSRDTFENHYVHSFPILSFTDKLLDIETVKKTASSTFTKTSVLQQL